MNQTIYPVKPEDDQPGTGVNVYLYQRHMDMLKSVGRRIGSNNTSAALRFIMTNWADLSGYNKVPEAEEVQG